MSIESIHGFDILPSPLIHFGPGSIVQLSSSVVRFGRKLLLVTGRQTLRRLPADLVDGLERSGIVCTTLEVDREPSPELIDRITELARKTPFDVVVSIGGGSVIDTGKAISAMLLQNHTVERFIEGQDGMLTHDGRKIPFIAVPTTAGTGSEVTSNSVISRVGPGGYKRSLRHPAFVPDVAIVDPGLMVTLPKEVTVSTGMDALTQLLEAYLSPFASPYTDAVCQSGLGHFSRSFERVCGDGAGDLSARGDMAWAALTSGIALANAGLGIVHGFASSVGGLFDIPHGTLCATLLAESTRENIAQLRRKGSGSSLLQKFASASKILGCDHTLSDDEACDQLVFCLESWQNRFAFPRLGSYGVRERDVDIIIPATRSRSNVAPLDDSAMRTILAARL